MRLASTLETLICLFAIAAVGSAQQDAAPASSSPPQTNAPASAPSAPASPTQPCPATASAGQTAPSNCKPTSSNTKHTKRKRTDAAQSTKTSSDQGPQKTVVQNGGATDPSMNISPGLSPKQASHTADATAQMMAATEANLTAASNRQLTSAQQDTIQQVHVLMDQASKAQKDGDLQRAYNLANKAKMLSAELVGH